MLCPWRPLARAAWPAAIIALLAGCGSTGRSPAPSVAPDDPSAPPVVLERPPILVVETIVTDRKGAPVTTLRASDFQVSVDGRRRLGVAVARLYRGPGAEALAASVASTAPGETQPVAESSRAIVIVVDQPSLGPADVARARTIVNTCLDTLGVADRVAVVPLPIRRGASIAFERAAVRDAMAALRPLRAAGAEALLLEAAEDAAADEAKGPPGGQVAPPPGQAGDARQAGRAPERAEEEAAAARSGAGDLSPAVLKAHAVSSLGALTTMLRALERTPGAKTVLLVSAGLSTSGAETEAAEVAEAAARAQARLFVLQVPTGVPAYREAGERDLRALAQETGGALVPLSGRTQAAIEQLAGQLAFSYLLLLAPMAGDAGPVPHAVAITLPRRPELISRTPARVVTGRITADAIAASLSPRAAAAPPPPPGPQSPSAGGPVPAKPATSAAPTRPMGVAPHLRFPHDPKLDPFIARVAEYVQNYGAELSSVVSEETYVQEANAAGMAAGSQIVIGGRTFGAAPAGGGKATRTLVSDFLQVKVQGMDGWLPFRDVFQVDGQPVRDRQDRLVKLFIESSPERALQNAQAIVLESARYNLGGVRREVNVPTLPLWFLEPANTRRFSFRKVDEETLNGRRVWVVEYTEIARPTFIKTPEGADIVASGRIWAEPTTGRVHRTLLTASVATITVNYAPRPEVPGLWMPVSMEEQYSRGNMSITGSATYAKYRQFQVRTSEEIVLPKK